MERLPIRCEVSARKICSSFIATCIAASIPLMLASGCQAPGPHPPGPPLDLASLVPQYPAIELSCAQTLADFQNPTQVRWFSVVTAAEEQRDQGIETSSDQDPRTAEPSPDPLIPRFVDPSGFAGHPSQPAIASPPDGPDDARCLRFNLNSASDRLVCDLQRAAADGAPRDWSEFGALLLRIWGPPDGSDAVLLIRSGGAAGFGEAKLPLKLASGWNLLTVDLDAMSRGRERQDMRQIEISPLLGSKPSTYYLDDLVLADHTNWSCGQNSGSEELYACSRGPRVFIGVRGRFELVFAEGAISAWYGTGLENLAGHAGLGPWPAFMASDWSGRPEDSNHGLMITGPGEAGVRPAGSLKIVEASAARVVVEGSRELGMVGDAEGAAAAELRRCLARYVIYPDAHVLVHTDLDAGPSGWPLGRSGCALWLDSGSTLVLSDRPAATPEREPANFALVTRRPPGVDLLWVPHAAGCMRWRRFLPETGRKPSLLLAGEMPAEPAMSTAQLLWFGPALIGADRAEEIASDYQSPVALRPDTGVLVTDAPGDLNHDGFNESEGCYELGLQRGRLRFSFDPGALPRQAPLFRVHGDENARCWIYADGQALPAKFRDAAGRVIFELPGTIRSPRVIEIYAG